MADSRSSQQLSVKVLLQIDSICDRFETALKAGQAAIIDDYLQGLVGQSRRLALRELLILEIGYRRCAGKEPTVDEYLGRFPGDREVVALAVADAGEVGALKSQDPGRKSPDRSPETIADDAQTGTFDPAFFKLGRTEKPVLDSSTRKPRPASLSQVIRWLVESELMTAEEIEEFMETLPPEMCDGKRAIEAMYRQGKLTKFQAQAVFQGKTRGLVVGNYVVLDRLGRGGMGYVYKARHRTMKRIVALKVLPSAAVSSAESVRRFHREVEAIARLRHANIVSAFDASEARGIHFLVMQCIEGQDLRSLVQDNGPLPARFAADCILQAARGLAYAHSQGVIHRDIKPGNLMLDAEGTVLVLDLGLAKIEHAAHAEIDTDHEELTRHGQLMGTPDFMSPEQAFDTRDADARSDIYSLGCTLYYLIAGKPPYTADTQLKKVLAHRNEPIPSLATAVAGVPASLDAVFQRMVAKVPDQRQQTMAQVIGELEDCLKSLDTSCPSAETIRVTGRENEANPETSGDSSSFLDVSLAMPSRLLKFDSTSSVTNRSRFVRNALLALVAVVSVLMASHWITSKPIIRATLVVHAESGAVIIITRPDGTLLSETEAGSEASSFSLNPGSYDLAVRMDGKKEFHESVTLESGSRLPVDVKLENLADRKPGLWPFVVQPLLEHGGSALAAVWGQRSRAASAMVTMGETVDRFVDHLKPSIEPLKEFDVTCLDLQPQANWQPGDEGPGLANKATGFPQGEQTFHGTKFHLGPKVIRLASHAVPNDPKKVEIRLGARIEALYFLHATHGGIGDASVEEGEVVGQYTVHYGDGTVKTHPISYGIDVRDWSESGQGRSVERGKAVALPLDPLDKAVPGRRLYLDIWENPDPQKPIKSIDFISTKTAAAPFCAAISAKGIAAELNLIQTKVVQPAASLAPPRPEPLVAEPDLVLHPTTHSAADDFEVEGLTFPHSRYASGERISFEYNLANVMNKEATIPPESAKSGVDQNFAAARRHWIELLDGNRVIPVLDGGQSFKRNRQYLIGEFLLVNKGKLPLRVKRNEKLPFFGEIDTTGFPPGKYRFTIELLGLRRHMTRSKQSLEFEIGPSKKL